MNIGARFFVTCTFYFCLRFEIEIILDYAL